MTCDEESDSKPLSETHSKPQSTCAMVKSRNIGDGHPTFNRESLQWVYKPYYWVDDHPLLYGNNESLDPIAHMKIHGKALDEVSVQGRNHPGFHLGFHIPFINILMRYIYLYIYIYRHGMF